MGVEEEGGDVVSLSADARTAARLALVWAWLAAPIGIWGRIVLAIGVAVQVAICACFSRSFAGAWPVAAVPDVLLYQAVCLAPFLPIAAGAILLGAPALNLPVCRWWSVAWWVTDIATIPLVGVIAFVDAVGTGLARGVP